MLQGKCSDKNPNIVNRKTKGSFVMRSEMRDNTLKNKVSLYQIK